MTLSPCSSPRSGVDMGWLHKLLQMIGVAEKKTVAAVTAKFHSVVEELETLAATAGAEIKKIEDEVAEKLKLKATHESEAAAAREIADKIHSLVSVTKK